MNAADVHHCLLVMREYEKGLDHVGPLPMTEDSVHETIKAILEAEDGDADAVFAKLRTQNVDIPLMAHPTEVNRKTGVVTELDVKRPRLSRPFKYTSSFRNVMYSSL